MWHWPLCSLTEESLFWMDDPQIHNQSEFFLSRDDYGSKRQTCPKSGKEAQCEMIYPVIVNKCWDRLGWLNGKKDGYQCKIYPVHVQIVQ